MAKLTKEEKAARKEAKKLAKLAAAEELRRKMKRDELTRELTAQNLRRAELERGWRAMMLTIKLPEFRRHVEVVWHTFERAYDKKDCLLKHILDLIEQANDQYGRTVASFCELIDNMTNKFFVDLEEMTRVNEQRTAELLQLGEVEAATIAREHNAAETHIQLLLLHAHTEAEDLGWKIRGENLVKADDEREKCLNERDKLRSFLESTYSHTWDEYKAVLKNYVSTTADNQKKVRRLRKKENIMADIIASQAKQMVTNVGKIKRLRVELQQYESGTKQAAFRERRGRYRTGYFTIKHDMFEGQDRDKEQLCRVVTVTNDTSEWLESAHTKGQKILRMAAMCRKFETQKEKVLPFGTSPPHEPVHCEKNRRGKPIGDPFVCQEIFASTHLSRLWERMSRGNVSLKALQREKEQLIMENVTIEQQIREYQESKRYQETTKSYQNYDVSKKPVAIEGALAYKMSLH